MTDTTTITEVPASEVRDWARRNGIPVGTRGHLSGDLVDQFNRRHRTKRFTSRNPALRDPEA